MREQETCGTARDRNLSLAQRMLAGIGSDEDPQVVAAIFAANIRFEVPGDNGVLPWIGYRAAAEFRAGTRRDTEMRTFKVEDIQTSDTGVVVVGELASRIKATDKIVEAAFALILPIAGGLIKRSQMLEDNLAISPAACAA